MIKGFIVDGIGQKINIETPTELKKDDLIYWKKQFYKILNIHNFEGKMVASIGKIGSLCAVSFFVPIEELKPKCFKCTLVK